MALVVYEDAVAPESYRLNIVPGDSGIDLSTVTAVAFSVQDQLGNIATWTATRSNQTATTLTATHVFIAADIASKGRYVVYAKLTVPGGTVRTAPQTLTVKGSFET